VRKSIRIDGEPVGTTDSDIDIVETEPGVYSILTSSAALTGAVSFEARVAGNEITIAGKRFRFELEDPRQWKRAAHGPGAHGGGSITASMPGKIVRVLVSVGDEVSAGQGILVVEAMKMQNEMKSPRDGRVTAIAVKENDSVNAGMLLAKIE
jgi:biotin carboxyl carrier protein